MAIEIVLFDLGGVLIELSSIQAMGRFLGDPPEEEVWRRCLSCPWVHRFERGMVETWSMAASPEVFLDANQINVDGARAAGPHAKRARESAIGFAYCPDKPEAACAAIQDAPYRIS